MNPAVLLTLSRIVLTPLILYLSFDHGSIQNHVWRILVVILLYVLASLTDWWDGAVARRYNMTSKLGEFLDPLADKVLTLSVFISFMYIELLRLHPVIHAAIWLIALREITITIIRVLALSRGWKMKTELHGKMKTVVQISSQICVYLVLWIFGMLMQTNRWLEFSAAQGGISYPSWNQITEFQNYYSILPSALFDFIIWLPAVMITLSAIITVISGISYVRANWKQLKDA